MKIRVFFIQLTNKGGITISIINNKMVFSLLLIVFVFLIVTTSSAAQQDTSHEQTIKENDNTINTYATEKDNVQEKYIEKNIETSAKGDANSTVSKTDPDIRLSDSEIHPGKDKTFLALLPMDAAGHATFKIDSKNISSQIPVEDGQVSYTYKIPNTFNRENYTLYLVYSGDETYNKKTVNATLTLTPEGGKVNATMTMKNYATKIYSAKTLTVKLNKDATGQVVFKIDNKNITKAIAVKNGVAKYSYKTGLTPGNHTLTASYTGNYKYEPTNISSKFIITKLNSKITPNNVTSKAGRLTMFKATLIDELGRAVKNMKVTFKLNKKVIGRNKTDSKGVIRLYYKIPSSLYTKTNNITVESSTAKSIKETKSNSRLTLKQLKTKVSVPSISTKPSKTVVITATVVDEFKNYVTKGYVTLKKGNKVLSKVKVSNGFAKYTFKANYQTSNKTYIYAKYVGDWKYASSSGKGTYKVTKLKTTTKPSSIETKPNSRITLTTRVSDQNQNVVTEGKVKFSIGKKVIGSTTVKNGIAKIRYKLNSYNAGNYRIKCVYLGSKIYKASSKTNTLTVNRYDTTLSGGPVNAVVGKKSSITLSVTDEEKYNVNKGTVKYYVNDEYIGSAKVSRGVSKLTYTLPGKFDGKIVKYYATYIKNGIYDSSSYSDTLTVTHQKTVYVSPSGKDTNVGDKTHPFKTIQHALTHTSLFGVIKVSPGKYSLSGIQLNESVTIKGSGRDKTVIDGCNSGKTIFNITKRNAVLTLEGITLVNGKSNSQFSAGAIVTSGKLSIKNSRFVNNTGNGVFSGGAIYTNGILNITNTEFINNKVTNANSQGGAIRCYENTTYITKCKFDSNKVTGSNSTGGSAIYADSSDIILNGTTFTKNSANGKYVTGGVIRILSGALVVDKCKIYGNSIKATDYAIGGVIGSLSSGVSITNSAINSNTVQATNTAGGSVLYVETAAVEINNTKMNSNRVTSKNAYGGAIYNYRAYITIDGSEMNANMLTATANGYGGAVYSFSGNLTVKKCKFNNNTIRSNDIALAGAIYSYSNLSISYSDFEGNNINASSLGGGAISNMGYLNASKSNFVNNYAYDSANAITATNTAVNNINGNYWGSATPEWNKLLFSVTQPSNYSQTRI